MSYESSSFVGVDSPITYLQCDVLICDSEAPDDRCRSRRCIPENVRRRRSIGSRQQSEHYLSKDHPDMFKIQSGPVLVSSKNKVHLARVQRSVENDIMASQQTHANKSLFSAPGMFYVVVMVINASLGRCATAGNCVVKYRCIQEVSSPH